MYIFCYLKLQKTHLFWNFLQLFLYQFYQHPSVLKNVKVNTKQYQGYAFGVGLDRLAMLKYGINDLRAFFESDIRWLEFYGFDPLDVPTNYRGLSR